MSQMYEFTFTLAGIDAMTVEIADALYEAGCDDGSPHSTGGAAYVTFHREAESLGDAIRSAVNDVGKAGYSVSKVEIEGVAA